MIWVADSGSTTTTWAEVETSNKVVTEGLNPLFSDDEQILAACRKVRKSINETITADSNINPDITLYFYGAGCGNKPQRNRMTQMLQKGLAGCLQGCVRQYCESCGYPRNRQQRMLFRRQDNQTQSHQLGLRPR